MTQQHPVTPPQWQIDAWQARIETMGADVFSILLEVVQWGFDQAKADIKRERQEAADLELEACLVWLVLNGYGELFDKLRAARRPKPQSLKEQSIALLDLIQGNQKPWQLEELDVVRRALESIPDPS